jgi:hypothetical protein
MEDFKKEIDKVLSGEIKLANTETLTSPDKIDSYLKESGLEQGNFDSNGWDWDFWMEYGKEDKVYILAGSGWYNTGLQFFLKKE